MNSICGSFDLAQRNRDGQEAIFCMLSKMEHRGKRTIFKRINKNLFLGGNIRESDEASENKVILYNEDQTVILIGVGLIYNYEELKVELLDKGHIFSSKDTLEILIHLYEENPQNFYENLNGQFAFALFDSVEQNLLLFRDHVGLGQLFYIVNDDILYFASEAKGILAVDGIEKEIDLQALDQLISLPGIVSPKTIFKNIHAVPPAHFLQICENGEIISCDYWKLDYSSRNERENLSELEYMEKFDEIFTRAVSRRLSNHFGCYLSGGLDSSMVAGKINQLTKKEYNSFSIDFSDKDISEKKYQQLVVDSSNMNHISEKMSPQQTADRLLESVYYSESPIKESYNSASLSLARMAKENQNYVILSGEGADELFGGYIGYRFDKFNEMNQENPKELTEIDKQLNFKFWGHPDFIYERPFSMLSELKTKMYSERVNKMRDQIDCTNYPFWNPPLPEDLDVFYRRSSIDFKVRMSDHLLGEHGERMSYASGIELRLPFLDREVIEFAVNLPNKFKLNDFTEKYILKKTAAEFVPKEIVERSKFAFTSFGSSEITKANKELVKKYLSIERIKKSDIFSVEYVNNLVKTYLAEDFKLNVPYDLDILMIILTTEILIDLYDL